MVKEEAKDYIREWCPYGKRDEIIKALEQQPCEDATLKEIFCTGCEHKEQEPCEDAVRRDAVIKAIDAHTNEDGTLDDDISIILEDLPSVTPIRPKGKWETGYTYPDGEYWKCSECGELIKVKFPMNFCNSCGADMKGDKK